MKNQQPTKAEQRDKEVKKLQEKDKKVLEWVEKGGRDGAKQDFDKLFKQASQPTKPSEK